MATNLDQPLHADAHVRKGIPTGTVTKHVWNTSTIYPGVTNDYWVYVPAQYQDSKPACVMVFQDGESFLLNDSPTRARVVFDNLIHAGEMPVTIGVFINPGTKDELWDQRSNQYVPLNDDYTRFLLDEILPEVGKTYNLTDDAEGRAICGMSDGGLCAFKVGWERPDAFSKVISHIGSFTRLHGGSSYPYLIRKTRGNPKPLRVFLQDGSNDINLTEGNWTLANLAMESALMFARWDYRFVMGTGGHDMTHGGSIFPDTLRWIWRDFPGVCNAETTTSFEDVVGTWQLTVNALGEERHSQLTVEATRNGIAGTLRDDIDGDVAVTAIDYSCDVLSFEYEAPESQKYIGKGPVASLVVWAKIVDNTLKGALSGDIEPTMDLSITGFRGETPKDTKPKVTASQ